MASTTESIFESNGTGEYVHPYMSLYYPVLDPSVSIYDDKPEESQKSLVESLLPPTDQDKLTRTSSLQKYPVRYSTRIYCVTSEDKSAGSSCKRGTNDDDDDDDPSNAKCLALKQDAEKTIVQDENPSSQRSPGASKEATSRKALNSLSHPNTTHKRMHKEISTPTRDNNNQDDKDQDKDISQIFQDENPSSQLSIASTESVGRISTISSSPTTKNKKTMKRKKKNNNNVDNNTMPIQSEITAIEDTAQGETGKEFQNDPSSSKPPLKSSRTNLEELSPSRRNLERRKREKASRTTKKNNSQASKDIAKEIQPKALPSKPTLNAIPRKMKTGMAEKRPLIHTKPEAERIKVDTDNGDWTGRYPKRKRVSPDCFVSNIDTDNDDWTRRYPKRKRVSPDCFVSNSKDNSKDKSQTAKSQTSKSQTAKRQYDRSSKNPSGNSSSNNNTDDISPPPKRRKKKKQRPSYVIYPNGKYPDADFEKIAKEKPNEDYSKDVVTDNGAYRDKIWNEQFRKLMAYYREFNPNETNNHTHKRNHTKADEDHSALLAFSRRQRSALRQRILHPDRFRRLNSINFVWNPKEGELSWMDLFERLVAFKEEYGHTNVPKRFKDDPRLGLWCREQRSLYMHQRYVLPQEKIDRLESIGFRWVGGMKNWKMRYKELKDFHKKHGHFRVPSDYPTGLGRWVQLRREEYARKRLPDDEMAMLKKIDFDWKLGTKKPGRKPSR